MVLSRCSYFYIVLLSVSLTTSCNKDKGSEHGPDTIASTTIEIANTKKDTVIFQELVQNYEDPERGVWQNPDLIIEKFGDLTNKSVADIGAGTGYFTFKLASKGASVVAVDIEEQFLDYIAERKQELIKLNGTIETRLSVPDDPTLVNEEVDFILIVNTYHFLENRSQYLQKLSDGLKTNGRIIIVDFKSGKLPVGPLEEFKTDYESVEKELVKTGFSLIETDANSLKYQYIITAEK